MNALIVARCSGSRSLTLRNLTLTEADAASWRAREVGRQELPQVIEQEFGIPRAIASEALEGVELTQNRGPGLHHLARCKVEEAVGVHGHAPVMADQ